MFVVKRFRLALMVVCSVVAAAMLSAGSAHAQRILEGPKTPSENVRTYRIGDERVRFTVHYVEGMDFTREYLQHAARAVADEAQTKNRQTHIWDNKWYSYAVSNLNVRKKYLMVVAHNVVTDELGWCAASFDGLRWNIMNNDGATHTPWNGEKVRFVFFMNAHRIDLSFYNPYEGGWNPHHIFCKIGEPLDPVLRERDEEGYKF